MCLFFDGQSTAYWLMNDTICGSQWAQKSTAHVQLDGPKLMVTSVHPLHRLVFPTCLEQRAGYMWS